MSAMTRRLASLIGVALFSLGVLVGAAMARERAAFHGPQFPPVGTPYALARATLLKQGLRIAPDKPKHPDRRFPEIDCGYWPSEPARCRALFLWRNPGRWRQYVVVEVDTKSGRITRADFPYGAEGLTAIPPRETADMPKIEGTYLVVRRWLKRHGYHPLPVNGLPGSDCLDKDCKRMITFPEAMCSQGVRVCRTYWRAPNGHVLLVMTQGEGDGGVVYFKSWASQDDLADLRR
jgi:hypothetical protein